MTTEDSSVLSNRQFAVKKSLGLAREYIGRSREFREKGGHDQNARAYAQMAASSRQFATQVHLQDKGKTPRPPKRGI